MIILNEFVYLYHLKESKEFGYYELVPWDRRSRIIVDLHSSFHYWKSRYFFVSGDSWETLSDDFWGDVHRLLRRWETPQLGAFALHFFFFLVYLFTWIVPFDLVCVFFFFLVRDHPKLESRFEERVWAAVEYVSTIDNFDDIVDPRTLARHFLGPEPSHYILNAIHHEERSESFWRKLIAYISSSFLLFLSFSFFF